MGVGCLDAGYIIERELSKLIENEDYIEYFREIFLKEINNTKQYKLKIDELLRFSKENNLIRSQAWGYYYFGWYNFDISEYEKAVNNFLTSYDLFEKHNYKDQTYFHLQNINPMLLLTLIKISLHIFYLQHNLLIYHSFL